MNESWRPAECPMGEVGSQGVGQEGILDTVRPGLRAASGAVEAREGKGKEGKAGGWLAPGRPGS